MIQSMQKYAEREEFAWSESKWVSKEPVFIHKETPDTAVKNIPETSPGTPDRHDFACSCCLIKTSVSSKHSFDPQDDPAQTLDVSDLYK